MLELQLLAFAATEQLEAVMLPVGVGLFSEQDAFEPPYNPAQVQVQVVEPLTLFTLLPTLQL